MCCEWSRGCGGITEMIGRTAKIRYIKISQALVLSFALVLQSFLPQTVFASAPISGVSHTVGKDTPYRSTQVDGSAFQDLTLSFEYNSTELDFGPPRDSFTYGWTVGAVDNTLGTIEGEASSGPNEVGSISVNLPPEALVSGLSVYVAVFANTDSDIVKLTNLQLQGTDVPTPDTTPPTIPTASLPTGTYTSAQSLALTATDDSGEVTIYYTADGSTPSQASLRYESPITISADTTLKAIAYDAANNASEVVTFDYIIDTTLPVIENISYSNDGKPTNGNVTVTITTSETVGTPSGWAHVSDTTFTKTYTSNTTEQVTVTDEAGNQSLAKTIEVKGIDKVAPAIALSHLSVNGLYSGPVGYTVSDDVAVASVHINGLEALASGTVASDGTHTITATDTAGNTASVAFTITNPVVPVLPIGGSTIAPSAPLRTTVKPVTPLAQLVPGRGTVVPAPGQPAQNGKSSTTANQEPATAEVDKESLSLAPSDQGWKLWGVAWYWYALAAAALSGGSWLFVRWRQAGARDEF